MASLQLLVQHSETSCRDSTPSTKHGTYVCVHALHAVQDIMNLHNLGTRFQTVGSCYQLGFVNVVTHACIQVNDCPQLAGSC